MAYVTSSPYWYDLNEQTLTPVFDHLDLDIFSGLNGLRGLFTIPNVENYYWPIDRIADLLNANYKPNSPYAYGQIFTTGEYAGALAPSTFVSQNITYENISDAATQLFSDGSLSQLENAAFCLMSVKLSTSEALKRNYYLELHLRSLSFQTVDLNAYLSCSIYTIIRIEDYETGVNNTVDIRGVSGVTLWWSSYAYQNYAIPVFGYWYNRDSAAPKLEYIMGCYQFSYAHVTDTIPMQNGPDITDNGHTFNQVLPQLVLGNNFTYTMWDSEAYLTMNPTNTVAFDQIVDEMGPFGPETDPNGTGYPTDQPEGHGDDSSDTIEIPDDPLIGVTNVGFVNVYKTGVSSLQDIGVELFPDLQYTNPTPISGSTDVVDSIQNGFNAIITALANIPSIVSQQVAATLINYIIDCHVLPVTPTGGTPENIKVGYKTLSATGDRLSTDYVPFDCGTIKLGEYYGSFADFMTSAKLFLPFVGFVPARPEWFYADTLGVKYKFNVIDGSFVAYVTSTGKYVNNGGESGTVIAQYSGNACVHLPITGVTYASMVSGLVGAGAGAVASAGSGSIAGVASSVSAAAGAHGDIPQSNAYASSGAFLSVRRPYLMIERPVTNYTRTFRKERGLPSNISKKLSDMRGFTILQDIHLDGITATDAEKKELEALLSKGVIF